MTDLEQALRAEVEGEVRFDAGSRALYATDASNFRQPPIGVVIPKTEDDVVATHRVCHDHGAPILARGCGTSLSGETVNHAVVIDFSKYLHRIIEIDPDHRTVRVQPGAINEQVNIACGRHGLVFGPDPSTHAYCTIGGNVGNNSCGVHSLLARFEGNGSRTSDNVAELDVLTYDGLRLRVGPVSDDELAGIIAAGGRRGEIYRRLAGLRDRLQAGIMAQVDGVSVNGNEHHRLPQVTNLSFANLDGEQLLASVTRDLAVSSGSACTSASMEPSYVLRALGVPDELAYASIRFSLGRGNDAEQIDFAVETVVDAVRRLREVIRAA